MALAVNIINRHSPSNEMHRQLQPMKTRVKESKRISRPILCIKFTIATVKKLNKVLKYQAITINYSN